MNTTHTRSTFRLPVLAALVLGALLTQATFAQLPFNKPLAIFQADRVSLKVSVDAISTATTGQVTYLLSWKLANNSGRTIYVEQGDRMPYAELMSPQHVDVNYTVKDIRPARIYFFDVPEMVSVAHRATLTGTFKITVPLQASDHYTLPARRATPIASPFKLSLRIGYMTLPFNVPLTSNVILNKFLDRQLEVRSNVLQL